MERNLREEIKELLKNEVAQRHSYFQAVKRNLELRMIAVPLAGLELIADAAEGPSLLQLQVF